jgi:hypothetical protein
MQQSEQINALAEALAKAQGAISNPSKNRKVTVQTRSGSSYEFEYATLDNIFDVIRRPLTDNGLSYTQMLDTTGEGKLRLVTILMHASGQWIKTETPVMVQEQTMQALGSAQTYARRYAISSLLGIAAEEDDDGNAADGNSVQDRTAPRRSPKTAKPEIKEGELWKTKAESIKALIDEAVFPDDVEKAIGNNSVSLSEIKEKSSTAYDFLMERATKRKTALSQKAA